MTRFLGCNLKVFKEFVKYYKGSASFQNKDVHVFKASKLLDVFVKERTVHTSLFFGAIPGRKLEIFPFLLINWPNA